MPDNKLARLNAPLDSLLSNWDACAAASAIGLLAPFAPALPLTPLLTRALREAQAAGSVEAERPLGMSFLAFWRLHAAAQWQSLGTDGGHAHADLRR